MSILSKNFFERLSGSRLTREAPRMENANNEVSEKKRSSMIFGLYDASIYAFRKNTRIFG